MKVSAHRLPQRFALGGLLAIVMLSMVTPLVAFGAEPASEQSQPTVDPLMWLEELKSARVLEWVREHNERSLKVLQQDPRYESYYKVALSVGNAGARGVAGISSTNQMLLDGWYYEVWRDAKHPRGIWRRTPEARLRRSEPNWQLVLDVDQIAHEDGRRWTLAFNVCLRQTLRCMVGLVDASNSELLWREFDLQRRSFVPHGFALQPAQNVMVTWKDADTLLVAADWGPGTRSSYGMPLIVKEWRRGSPISAVAEVFRGRNGLGVLPQALEGNTGEHTAYIVDISPKDENTLWIEGDAGAYTRTTLPPSSWKYVLHQDEIVFVLKGDWVVGSKRWKGGSLVSIPRSDLLKDMPDVRLLMEPGPRESIFFTWSTASGVLASSYLNVRGQLLRFVWREGAWVRSRVSMPDNGTINFTATDPTSDTALVSYESFLDPTVLYEVKVASGRAVPIGRLPSDFDGAQLVTEQLEAVSRDGTSVPYFVVRPKAFQPGGRAPTLLDAYGGGVPQYPSYSGVLGRLWLEQGGVYVLANIRGGGEFGPSWQAEGRRRQVVYDDFHAVAADLVRRKITSPRHLGILGHSAGALLMAVAITQHPEMYNAAVISAGPLDLARWHAFGDSAAAGDQFGSPSDPADMEFIRRTSPYGNLTRRADFPVPFILTSTSDDRVHPGHSRKFAARLDRLNMPYFYYESADAGHGAGVTPQQRAMRHALIYTYLARQLR